MITTANKTDREAIAREIHWAAPIVAGVELHLASGGWEAHLTLDPAMVRARAGQQGLRDRSISAAAADPRLQRALEQSIARANARLGPEQQIVHHLVVIA